MVDFLVAVTLAVIAYYVPAPFNIIAGALSGFFALGAIVWLVRGY